MRYKRMYNQIVIGIDQSYKNTGISLVADNKIRDIKSIRLEKYSCNSERRKALGDYLERLMLCVNERAIETVCVVERTRIHGGGSSYINVDVIKSMGALTALIVDVMYRHGVKVYSVDTRTWKSKVVGTSKPVNNNLSVPPEKWPTIRWLVQQGLEDKILVDVSSTRKCKGVFERSGRRYMYNDDAADSAGIAMYYVLGDRDKLQLEK